MFKSSITALNIEYHPNRGSYRLSDHSGMWWRLQLLTNVRRLATHRLRYLGCWRDLIGRPVNGVHPVNPLATSLLLKAEVVNSASLWERVGLQQIKHRAASSTGWWTLYLNKYKNTHFSALFITKRSRQIWHHTLAEDNFAQLCKQIKQRKN